MARASGKRLGLAGLVGLFLVASVIGLELARPFQSASIAFDSQVAVVHFDRLIHGARLEQFLSTTPKPLLTMVYGPLHALTNEWRPIAWATILAFGIGIVGVGILAGRVAGPAAGAFSALAVLASPTLLFDVGYALATPWALIGWVSAGLALTAERPRYGLAGLSLLLASLARVETLLIVGLAAAVLVGAQLARRPVARRAWLVPLVGSAALLVMTGHDALLTGDPLFWSKVAMRYSQETALHVQSPQEVIEFLVARYAGVGALTLLSIVGLARALAAGKLSIAFGLIGLGPGVAVFLVFLAARGIFVSDRYAAPIDVAVAFSAGIALAGLSVDVLDRLAARGAAVVPGGRQALVTAAAAVVAVALTWPSGPFDAALRKQVRASLDGGINADRAVSVIHQRGLDGDTGPSPRVFSPTPVRPRVAIDLGLALTEVGATDGLTIDVLASELEPGQIVIRERRAAKDQDVLAAFEVDVTTVVHGLSVEPLLADRQRGLWVVVIR